MITLRKGFQLRFAAATATIAGIIPSHTLRSTSGGVMGISEIIHGMRDRMPWPVAQRILAVNSLPRGMGWDKTVEKLVPRAEELTEHEAALSEALKEHILCGEKSVQIFNVNADLLDQVRAALDNVVIEDTPFLEVYPALLNEEALAGQPLTMQPVAVERVDEGRAVIFASVRIITVREPINIAELADESEEVQGYFDGFDEIIGLRHVRHQAMDVVYVSDDGAVDVRIDAPVGTTADVTEAAHTNIVGSFNSLVGVEALTHPVNLFPLIDRMYRDPDEGIVVELGFGTSTSSLKHEKMRRKTYSLREEDYHVGGKAALTLPIEPFRLGIIWHRKIDESRESKPELMLQSNSRSAHSQSPTLFSSHITKCMGLDDYNFVLSRIQFHLEATAAEEASSGP